MNDPLMALLAEAIPVREQELATDHALLPIMDELRSGLVQENRSRRFGLPGRRRTRLMAAGVCAATLLVGGTALAGGLLPAHTGEHGEPGKTENDTSEWLRLNSPEITKVIDSYGAGIPLPPRGDWTYAKRTIPTRQPTQIQVTGLKATLSGQAICQWEFYWLAARDKGDEAGLKDAQRIIDAYPTWEVVKNTDGGGTVAWRQKVADTSRTGDPKALKQDLAANCNPEMWPGAAK